MAFKKGKRTIAHCDLTVKARPLGGTNEGQELELRTVNSLSWNYNGTSVYLKGTAIGPVATVPGSAEPTFELGLSALEEADDLKKFGGAGYMKFHWEFTVVASTPGKPAKEYVIKNALLNDAGAESDDGSAPSDTIGGSCEDITIDGVSGLYEAGEEQP